MGYGKWGMSMVGYSGVWGHGMGYEGLVRLYGEWSMHGVQSTGFGEWGIGMGNGVWSLGYGWGMWGKCSRLRRLGVWVVGYGVWWDIGFGV